MTLAMVLIMMSQQPPPPVDPFAEGWASYYTVASSSNLTASGEEMIDGKKTCAMRKGSFGERVLVVTESGRSVVCRINDRGPYVRGRVIDLSKAAMEKLGGVHRGVIRVKVYRIGKER